MKTIVAATLALLTLSTPASGQGLYRLGFTLDGSIGPGYVDTPLGVVSVEQYAVWWLTLRGQIRADAVRLRTAQVMTP